MDRSLILTRPRRGLALVLAAAAWLSACGGGGGDTPAPPPPSSAPEGLATAQTGEVLAYVKQKLQARGPMGLVNGDLVSMPAWLGVVTATSTTTTSATGTVVQEAGVDEADLMKTADGRIYTLQPLQSDLPPYTQKAQLVVHALDAAGKPQRIGNLVLENAASAWSQTRGLLLAGGQPRLAVVSESVDGSFSLPDCAFVCAPLILPWAPAVPYVNLHLVEARQPAAMPRPQHWQIDGRLVGTRQVGNTLYLVATHQPRFAFDQLPASSSAAERQAVLDRLTVAELLPKIRIDGGAPQPLVSDTDCWIQPANASAQLAVTTITAVDLESPTWARSTRCFVGGTEALYMAPTNLYLATTRNEVTIQGGLMRFAPEMATDIHKFRIDGSAIAYRGSGIVAGSLGWDPERRAYRMSEHNGLLRVLSFTGTFGWATAEDASRVAPSPATLTILRDDIANRRLTVLSTLPNARRPAAIGKPGEQVYGVRFAGDRGYVVTFRRIDPLYVLDLLNPNDPQVAGELQVTGFSDWLYPIDGGLLLGIGKDADDSGRVQGVKVALFDVRDAARPSVLSSRTLGGPGSFTALDYTAHGLGWLQRGETTRVSLPMTMVGTRGDAAQQQLQRIEVDGGARSLRFKDPIDLGSGWTDYDTRTLLLGEQVHLLSRGILQTWSW
ncbi:MAG: beta-propeller domain-containing protein [Rubrivivax sp.]